jgi:Predicted transcriptional regulator
VKIDRLLSIVMVLLEKKKVSAPELARTFEVSVRTIYRDIDAINQAGLPVVTSQGVGGGISLVESYKPDKRLFSAKDVTMLLMALGSVRTSFSSGEMAGAIAKIKGLVPEDERKAIEVKAGQISIDLTPWSGSSASVKLLKNMQTALLESRLLSFDYQDRHGRSSSRLVEPYRLILKRMSWYVGGYCRVRKAMRLFKLSRIANMSVSKEIFEPRPVDMESFIDPTFDDGECFDGMLRVRANGRETILELFGEDVLTQETDATWVARIPLSDNEQGYSFVAGLGYGCEILEPRGMRQKMRQYLANLLTSYT